MKEIFTQIGDGNTQNIDKRKGFSANSWPKVVIAIITTIGVIIAALLASPWLPQIWSRIKGI